MLGVAAHRERAQAADVAAPDARVRRRLPVGTALTALLVLAALAVVGVRAAGLQPLTVLTGSMQPAIDPGDVVLVSRTVAADVRVGDVVTFAAPDGPTGRTLTHRVRAVRRTSGDRVTVTTRGDANPVGETWTVPRSGTVGRVRAVLPHAGALALHARTGAAQGVLLALMTFGACVAALWAIWRRGPT